MSHFTRVRTKLVERDFLLKALDDLGYPYEAGKSQGGNVGGWQGRTTKAEIVVKTKTPGYDIGFVKNGDTYDAVADWSMLRSLSQPQFLDQLTQRYAYHTTKAKLEEQGFNLVEEEKQADGRIHLVVRRMM